MSNKKKYTVYETGKCGCDPYKYGAFGVCPECNGTGIRKREVDLLEALRELGVVVQKEEVLIREYSIGRGRYTYRLDGWGTLDAESISDAIEEAKKLSSKVSGYLLYDSNEVIALP